MTIGFTATLTSSLKIARRKTLGSRRPRTADRVGTRIEMVASTVPIVKLAERVDIAEAVEAEEVFAM